MAKTRQDNALGLVDAVTVAVDRTAPATPTLPCEHCGLYSPISLTLPDPAGGLYSFCCHGCREVYRLWHDLPETDPTPLSRFFSRFLTNRVWVALTAE